jgi:hypothetical protein
MKTQRNVLVLGASYGSLLGIKLSLAGHRVHFACLPDEADLINANGIVVRMPVKGAPGEIVELHSTRLRGPVSAGTPASIDPAKHDLVALAMQEPQYRAPEVRALLGAVARMRLPSMSIMNMPPLPYLERLPAIDVAGCRAAYTDPGVWEGFDPDLFTLCSPDPQAFRPPGEPANILQVRLPTNFKAARFGSDVHTTMLRELASDIEAARFETGGRAIELPVKLRVHDSLFVPLAKWPMLIAGNYRCVHDGKPRSIKEAVHDDIATTRSVYEWVAALCRKLGAAEQDLVPFEKYANAAQSLGSPSSAARALFGGARFIERVDLLVQTIAQSQGMRLQVLDDTVAQVDALLQANRSAVAVA